MIIIFNVLKCRWKGHRRNLVCYVLTAFTHKSAKHDVSYKPRAISLDISIFLARYGIISYHTILSKSLCNYQILSYSLIHKSPCKWVIFWSPCDQCWGRPKTHLPTFCFLFYISRHILRSFLFFDVPCPFRPWLPWISTTFWCLWLLACFYFAISSHYWSADQFYKLFFSWFPALLCNFCLTRV